MIKRLIGVGLFAFLILKLVTHGLNPEDFYSPRNVIALIGSLAALSVYFYYQYQTSIGFSVAHLAPPIGILVSLLSITPSLPWSPSNSLFRLHPQCWAVCLERCLSAQLEERFYYPAGRDGLIL